MMEPSDEKEPRKRGFAAMDPKKRAAIASKGGKAAHAQGTAHQFSSEEARKAGKKGGVAPHVRRGAQKPKKEPGPIVPVLPEGTVEYDENGNPVKLYLSR